MLTVSAIVFVRQRPAWLWS